MTSYDVDYRRKLKEGRNLVGMMHFTGSPMMVEVMACAGIDFVNIDMEHSPNDIGHLPNLIRAADAAGITPFVRIPGVDAGLIKRILNLGAQGIIIPHASREDCIAAVDASRYEPEGSRGSCPAVRAARYSQPDWDEFTRRMNREITVIPLLEEKKDVDEVEAILDIDGVDIIFLGPFDYSVALGIPGATFDHPRMAHALERLVEHAAKRSKYVMTSAGGQVDHAYAQNLFARGIRLINFSSDAAVFLEACRRIAATRDMKAAVTI